jgi:N-methylhydantoinase A
VPMFILGVDVGGTFTDLVAVDAGTGEIRTTKVLSLRDNPAPALASGISELGLSDVGLGRVVHGTTVATNALIERRGAVTALITTRGFRDTTEIGRGRRLVHGAMFDSRFRRAQPIVPRSRRFEVSERLNAQGEATTKLDKDDLVRALDAIRAEKANSIAICFLHSHRNSVHERAAADYIREQLGADIFLSVSSDVDPQFREFERFSTTVANAYVGPTTRAHIDDLREQGKTGARSEKIFIMGSSGGVMDFDTAAQFPVRTILSGPAGGVMAARAISRHLGFENIITCDMGGTSTDVALLTGGRLLYASETIVSGIPVRASQLDINTIAAGAGSLIWLDVDNALRIGPASAGSMPGPACYGRGGHAPTITDANVVLNRIRGGTLLGGKIRVDDTAAAASLGPIQQRLGLASIPELAEGALQLVEVKIVSAIREISLERGFDPRDFALMAFGGAGPMHGCFIAERLGMRCVIVPNGPGVFSAFGLILGNMRRENIISHMSRLSDCSVPSLRTLLGGAVERLSKQLLWDKVIPETIVCACAIEMRSKGQSHEIAVPIDCSPADLSRDHIELAFRRMYTARYGQSPDNSIDREIIALRVVCEGRTETLPLISFSASRSRGPAEIWPIRFGGRTHDTQIYHRKNLAVDDIVQGPAVVNEAGATTILPPQWTMRVHPTGALLLMRQAMEEVEGEQCPR